MENTTFVAHLQSIEDMHTSDSIVIIPTYNERENIENILRAVFALEHGFHILVQYITWLAIWQSKGPAFATRRSAAALKGCGVV